MYWIEDADAVSVMPTVKQATTTERHFFQDGNPQMGKAATVLTPDFMNMLEEELLNFVEGLGITPEKGNHRQMLAAVRKMMFAAGGILPWDRKTAYDRLPDGRLHHIVWGDDNKIYIAAQPSGPGVTNSSFDVAGPQDPTTTEGYWLELGKYLAGGGGGMGSGSTDAHGGLILPGTIEFLFHDFNELPFGRYFCNGQRYADTHPAGIALQELPESLRHNLNITTTSLGTNVPDLFYNGRGLFLRSADGITRLPGSIEEDAGKSGSITDVMTTRWRDWGPSVVDGIISIQHSQGPSWESGGGGATMYYSNRTKITINGSSDEYRPMNIGATPAIYLGV